MINLFRNSLIVLMVLGLGTSGCSKETKKAKLLERADANFKAEEFEKAEIDYLNVLRTEPDPTAIRQLGLIFYTQGRLRDAFRFLQKAAELEPENVDVQLKLGMAYLAFGKLDEARELARGVLAKRVGDEDALLLLAETSTPKNTREIQQQIEKFRAGDKPRASYHLALGTLLLRVKEIEKAQQEFNSALKLDPASASAQLALGNIYWFNNQLDKADNAFKTAASSAPLRSPRRLKYADFQIKTGKLDDARKTLQAITSKAPDYSPAWSYLIRVEFFAKKYDECAALIEKALARDSSNYEALLYSGYLKLREADGPKAIALFERINTLHGESAEVHFQLGRAHLLNSDPAKAAKSFDRALAFDPDFTDALLLLSEIKIQQGDSATILPQLIKLTRNQPKNSQGLFLLAAAYLDQNKVDDAVEVYTGMTKSFPKDPQPQFLLGSLLMQQGKRSQARNSFEQSLKIAPGFLQASEKLVDLDILEKKYDAALSRVQDLMKPDAMAVEPWLLQAKVHLAQTNSAQAEASLKKAISLNPEHRAGYLLLSQLYVESNRHKEALVNLETLVKKTNDVPALMQIGMIHDHLKDYPASRDTYERIYKINPQYAPALNNLAYIYSEHLGQLDKAFEMAQKARQLLPADPATADTLGWISYKRADYTRALSLLKESAGKLPEQEEIQFHLGMTHYMMGEEAPARIALQKAVDSKNNFSGKEEGKQRLAILAIDTKTAGADTLVWLEKKAKESPKDPIILMRLASIQERNGAFDNAIKSYEKALALNPKSSSIAFKLAQLHDVHVKDSEKAMSFMKKARDLAPEDPNIAYALGKLSYQSKDYVRALALLQESARKLPDQPELFYDLAWAHYSFGRVTEADEAMQKALTLNGSFPRVESARQFLTFRSLYREPTKAPTAAAQIQEALQKDANYVPALAVMALAQEQKGDSAAAIVTCNKILSVFPSFGPATKQLAILSSANPGNDKTTYDVAVKARELYPQDSAVAKALGIVAYRRGEFARASQLLKESGQKLTNDADLFYHLGLSYRQLKQNDSCKEALNKALALNSNAPFAAEAKKILLELK